MYVTQADMIARFGEQEIIQLTDRVNPPVGIIDPTILDMAIADADGLIDTYIKRRYPQPLADTPAPLKRHAADIARYYLYGNNPTEPVENAYKAALSFLKDVAAARASLGPDASGDQPTTANGAEMIAPDRIFGRNSRDFI